MDDGNLSLGASDGPGSRASTEPQSTQGLGPTGFDPSRGAKLTVEAGAYSSFWRHAIISQMLDIQESENANRDGFRPGISRDMVERAINQLFSLYECRVDDFAAAYGWTGLWTILGLDWTQLVFVSRDSDGSPKGGDAKQGSVEDDSAGL